MRSFFRSNALAFSLFQTPFISIFDLFPVVDGEKFASLVGIEEVVVEVSYRLQNVIHTLVLNYLFIETTVIGIPVPTKTRSIQSMLKWNVV